jgi:hypothetical protein
MNGGEDNLENVFEKNLFSNFFSFSDFLQAGSLLRDWKKDEKIVTFLAVGDLQIIANLYVLNDIPNSGLARNFYSVMYENQTYISRMHFLTRGQYGASIRNNAVVSLLRDGELPDIRYSNHSGLLFLGILAEPHKYEILQKHNKEMR